MAWFAELVLAPKTWDTARLRTRLGIGRKGVWGRVELHEWTLDKIRMPWGLPDKAAHHKPN